jgi:hypothetical protein
MRAAALAPWGREPSGPTWPVKVTLVLSGPHLSRFHDGGRARRAAGRQLRLQAGVDWLGFQRENGEYALVHPPQWFTARGPVQALEPEGVLAQGQRALVAEPALA